MSRGRFALVVALVAFASVLTAASAAPTMTTQALVVLTALSAAVALTDVQLTLPGAGHHGLRPPRRASVVPLVLAGRTTDVVHHPVRPRAPGLV